MSAPILASRPTRPLVCEATPEPIYTICPDCGGEGSRYTSRYGGNDPDVWRAGPCETCEETGYVEVCCDLCGEYGANEMFQGKPFHDRCAAEERKNAFQVGED